jgi:hypothetical protein
MSQAEIDNEINKIAQLRQQSKNLILPRRSIAYQFVNMRSGNRNITQELAIRRKQRKKIDTQINTSQNRIISLREALLGVTS